MRHAPNLRQVGSVRHIQPKTRQRNHSTIVLFYPDVAASTLLYDNKMLPLRIMLASSQHIGYLPKDFLVHFDTME
jgi:hypothetical protein